MAERAHPEDKLYTEKTKYYHALEQRYTFGARYTSGKRVLDIPSGTGYGISMIKNASTVSGVDISKEAVEYANNNYEGSYTVGSMTDIPYEAEKFDVVLCFEGMEHISRKEGIDFINEVKRVLVRNGYFVGSVPVLDEFGRDTGNPYHPFEYPLKYLKKLLKQNFTLKYFKRIKGADGPIVFFAARNTAPAFRTIILDDIQNPEELKEAVGMPEVGKRIIAVHDTGQTLSPVFKEMLKEKKVILLHHDFNKKQSARIIRLWKVLSGKTVAIFKSMIRVILPQAVIDLIKGKKNGPK